MIDLLTIFIIGVMLSLIGSIKSVSAEEKPAEDVFSELSIEDILPETEEDLADPNGFIKYSVKQKGETIQKEILKWRNKYPIEITEEEIQVQFRNLIVCYNFEFEEVEIFNSNSNMANPPRKAITQKVWIGSNNPPQGISLNQLKAIQEEVFDQMYTTESGEIKIHGIEPTIEETYKASVEENDFLTLVKVLNSSQENIVDNEPMRNLVSNYLNNKGLRNTKQGLILPTIKNIGKLVEPRDLVKIMKDELLDNVHKHIMVKETLCDMSQYSRYAEKTPNKLLFPNGFFDFDTFTFNESSEDIIIITKECPYNYRPELIGTPAPEPVKELCTSIKENSYEDLEYTKHIKPLLQAFGYLLTDGNPLKCIITFIGERDSGKGIAIKIMAKLVNDKISQADIFDFREIHNELQHSLIRNDLNIINEFTAMKDNAGFRNITGNDPIETRQNYCGSVNHPATEVSKTILSTNRLNKLIDTVETHDYDRLSYFIEFQANYNEKNPNLENSIIEDTDTMEWILANSIHELEQTINTETGKYILDCHHNEEELLNMIEKYENPDATKLKANYIFDPLYQQKPYTNEDFVLVEDIKKLLPHIRQNRKFNELIQETYDTQLLQSIPFKVNKKTKKGFPGLIYLENYISDDKITEQEETNN